MYSRYEHSYGWQATSYMAGSALHSPTDGGGHILPVMIHGPDRKLTIPSLGAAGASPPTTR